MEARGDGSLSIAVYCIDSTNFKESLQALQEAIYKADYTAIDLEMSGIGSKESLRAISVQDRYSNLCQTASTHSVLSMGVACFRSPPVDDGKPLILECSVFDILLFSQSPYMVNPNAIEFLCANGFDFNNQYRHGLRYTPTSHQSPKDKPSFITKLFMTILKADKPLILHNGLIDLVFMYSHFYATPPTELGVFAADWNDMIPAGIYDTKHIPLSSVLVQPSYLEYLLYQSWYRNCRTSNGSGRIQLVSLPVDDSYPTVPVRVVESIHMDTTSIPAVCQNYAERGFCSHTPNYCAKSHNMSHIIASEGTFRDGVAVGGDSSSGKGTGKKRNRKRNRKQKGLPSFADMFSEDLAEIKKKLSTENAIKQNEENKSGDLVMNQDNSDETIVQQLTPNDNEPTNEGAQLMNDQYLLNTEEGYVAETNSTVGVAKIDSGIGVTETDSEVDVATTLTDSEVGAVKPNTDDCSVSHKSSRDAFATGFYFIQSALSRYTATMEDNRKGTLSISELLSIHQEHRNKVPISGKQMPLLITNSCYCTISDNHKRMKLTNGF